MGIDRPSGDHILVIDDDQHFRSVMVATLESLGYLARSVHSVAAAAEALADSPALAVLCDVELGPGPDGVEFLETFRDRCPEGAIALVTGHRQHYVRSLQPDSPFPVLMKPFTRDDLGLFIRSLLDG